LNLRKTDFYRGIPVGSDNFNPGYKPSGVLINLLAAAILLIGIFLVIFLVQSAALP
jgi:hypothetical protein